MSGACTCNRNISISRRQIALRCQNALSLDALTRRSAAEASSSNLDECCSDERRRQQRATHDNTSNDFCCRSRRHRRCVEQLLLTLFVLFAATCTDCKSSHNRLVFVLIFALLEIMYQGDLAYENCHIWFTCLHSFRSHMLDSRPFSSRANSLPGANRPIGP